MRRFVSGAAILALCSTLLGGVALGQMSQENFADGHVSTDGTISLPANFRTDYVMLGAWSVAGDVDTGGEVGLHVVYAPREAVDEYRKNGQFADGTVLVKELFKGHTADLTTGRATRAKEVAGYFVMVKDAKGRFPDNPLWGDGWGWAFFAADNTAQTVTKDYAAECLDCHEPARSTDLVYIDAYPVLK